MALACIKIPDKGRACITRVRSFLQRPNSTQPRPTQSATLARTSAEPQARPVCNSAPAPLPHRVNCLHIHSESVTLVVTRVTRDSRTTYVAIAPRPPAGILRHCLSLIRPHRPLASVGDLSHGLSDFTQSRSDPALWQTTHIPRTRRIPRPLRRRAPSSSQLSSPTCYPRIQKILPSILESPFVRPAR